MNSSKLTTIEKSELLRIIARLDERIRQLERILSGQPVGTVRIADGAITNAKITSLSADKITTGNLIVAIGVGNGHILIDGENERIIINDGTNDRVLLGYGQGLF